MSAAIPRVLFDHQVFDSQCYGGASRVCVETARCAEGLFDSLWGIEATSNAYLAEWLGLPVEEELATDAKPLMLRRFWGKRTGRPAETLAERNRRRSLKMAREKKPDLIFATYYDPFWVEEKRDARLVVIVHDLIHETFPEFFNINCEVTQRKRLLVEAADHLFAVSLTTKDALVRLWSVDPAKITVALLGSSLNTRYSPGETGPGHSDSPYLLYVGWRSGYKNFYFAVEALAPLFREWKELRLVCVGPPFVGREKGFLKTLGIFERVEERRVGDAELSRAYHEASAVLVSSYAEGFGLPIVEALSFGKPVAASRIPVFREVGGDLLEYFDPKDSSELRAAVERALLDRDPVSAESRRARARRFSWDRTAAAWSRAFRDLAGFGE